MKDIDIHHLVFSGGGIRSISFLSALNYITENKIINLKNVKSISGTSAGSIIGLLLVIGYNTDEALNIFKNTDLKRLASIKIRNMFTCYGLDSGYNLMVWFIKQVTEKLKKNYPNFAKGRNLCKITFSELYSLTKIKFNVTGTNVTKRQLCYFNYETSKDMYVFDAIRISISVPFIYNCCPYKGDLYADGGLLNNFPMEIAEKESNSDENILGVRVLPFEDAGDQNINKKLNFQEYVVSVIECLFYQIHKLSDREHTIFKHNTDKNIFLLNICTSNNVAINFNITRKQVDDLIDDGELCAKRWSLAQELNYFFNY